MFILATDLDRTLFPNGKQEYDGSMTILKKIIGSEKIKLIFVTGRNIDGIEQGIEEFEAPFPDFAVAEVGTKIYKNQEGKLIEDKRWLEKVNSLTKGWNIDEFKKTLQDLEELRMQEDCNQNEFKLSYYVDDPDKSDDVVKEVTRRIKDICNSATIVYSVDETHNIGLLDILPRSATKLSALEYLRSKLKMDKKDIVYSGDSGNDILPLTFGYRSIVVKNAIDDVKTTVKESCKQKNNLDSLYIAQGLNKLNGYYVSGIIEGLLAFDLISEEYLK